MILCWVCLTEQCLLGVSQGDSRQTVAVAGVTSLCSVSQELMLVSGWEPSSSCHTKHLPVAMWLECLTIWHLGCEKEPSQRPTGSCKTPYDLDLKLQRITSAGFCWVHRAGPDSVWEGPTRGHQGRICGSWGRGKAPLCISCHSLPLNNTISLLSL